MGKKDLSEEDNLILESFYTKFIDKMLEWELWERNPRPTAQEKLIGMSVKEKMDTLNTIKQYGEEDIVDTNVREQARIIVAGLSAPPGSVAARVRERLGFHQEYDEYKKPEARKKITGKENKEWANSIRSQNAKELERIKKNNKLEFQRNHDGPPPTYTPKSWKFWGKPKNPIEDNLFQLKCHLEDENFIFAQYFVDKLLEMGCNDKKFIKLKRQIETTKKPDDKKKGSYISYYKEKLSHGNPGDRMEAITTLAKYNRNVEVVIPIILPMLKDEDKMVRLRATEALAYLTDEDFGENLSKWQQWWEKYEDRSLDKGKVSCSECGAKILPSTAHRTNGLCMPCSK